MEIYLLKSAACLGILFLFYKLVLENTSLHTIKRFFLLGSLAISFAIPFITFTEYIEITPVVTETLTQIPVTTYEPTIETGTPVNYLPYILGATYGLGVLIFGFRFGRNMFRILSKARNNPAVKRNTILHVLLQLPVTPHSFFNYIFFNKIDYNKGEIPQEVIIHETAHVAQKHSWDIVFIEVLRIVFWFNPLLYFIKHSIKLNHEFLADRTVLNKGAELSTYQTILLDFSSPDSYRDPSLINLAHSINYSSIKKRFTVMKTHTSNRAAWLKGLLVLPLLAILIYGFSTTQVVEKIQSNPKVSFHNPEVQQEYEEWYNETVQKLSNDKATPEQLEIYNKLAKKYNAVPISERKIGWEDLMKLENLYRKMSATQKKNALSFPECLPKNQTSWEQDYAKAYNDGAERNNKKSIVITVNISEIMINGKTTSLKNFAKEIDKITKDWTRTDFQMAHPSVLVAGTPDSFLEKLDAEFRKTKYFKANGGVSIIPTSPPPPAPDAPKVLKGENDNDPNVPPPPPSPKVLKGVNDGDPNVPPPTPPPTSPLDHIIEMSKKNATFYFEGKQITSDKAIELLKKNKNLNIQTTGSSSKNPQVKISTKPITFDSNKNMGTVVKKKIREAPKPTSGNVLSHLKVMNRHGATFYFNGSEITFKEALKIVRKDLRQGFKLDVSSDSDKNETYINGNTFLTGVLGTTKQIKATLKMTLFDPPNLGPKNGTDNYLELFNELEKKGTTFYTNGDFISKKEAIALCKEHKIIAMDTIETPHNVPSIVFSKI